MTYDIHGRMHTLSLRSRSASARSSACTTGREPVFAASISAVSPLYVQRATVPGGLWHMAYGIGLETGCLWNSIACVCVCVCVVGLTRVVTESAPTPLRSRLCTRPRSPSRANSGRSAPSCKGTPGTRLPPSGRSAASSCGYRSRVGRGKGGGGMS
jgi:hypothetical protein